MRYCYYVYDFNNGIWNTSKPVGSTKYSQWKILLNPYLRRPPYFIHVPMYSVTFPWCFPVLRSRPLADSFLKTGALECLEGFLDEWCLPPKNPALKLVGLSPKNGHLGFWWLVYHQKNEGPYHSNLREMTTQNLKTWAILSLGPHCATRLYHHTGWPGIRHGHDWQRFSMSNYPPLLVYMGVSHLNGWLRGTSILGNPHMVIYCRHHITSPLRIIVSIVHTFTAYSTGQERFKTMCCFTKYYRSFVATCIHIWFFILCPWNTTSMGIPNYEAANPFPQR